MHVRPGIFFSEDPAFNGKKRELVAADYVYSWKRLLDPKVRSPFAWYLQGKIVGADRALVVGPGVALAGLVGLEALAGGVDVAEGVVDVGQLGGLPGRLHPLDEVAAVDAPLGEVAHPLEVVVGPVVRVFPGGRVTGEPGDADSQHRPDYRDPTGEVGAHARLQI